MIAVMVVIIACVIVGGLMRLIQLI